MNPTELQIRNPEVVGTSLLSCRIKPGLFQDERVVVLGSNGDCESFFVDAEQVDEARSALKVELCQAEGGSDHCTVIFRADGYLTQVRVDRSALR